MLEFWRSLTEEDKETIAAYAGFLLGLVACILLLYLF